MSNEMKGLEFSYSINEEEKIINFYYIIRKSMGVKIKIKLPYASVDTSQILVNLIPYFGNTIEDFDAMCLNLLDKLPGNIQMYPEVVILYDNSNNDVLGRVDLDNLDDYKGDIFRMHKGVLDMYADSKHKIEITAVDDENYRLCYMANILGSSNSGEVITSLCDSDSNSSYVRFGKRFVERLDEIRSKEVKKGKKRVRTKKDA